MYKKYTMMEIDTPEYFEAIVLNNLLRKGCWKRYDREESIASGKGGDKAIVLNNKLIKKRWILKTKHQFGFGYCLNLEKIFWNL